MVNKQLARGDPGFFSFLGGLAKTVGKVAGFIPGVGTAISAATSLVGNVLDAAGGGGAPSAPPNKIQRQLGRKPSFSLQRYGSPSLPPSVSMAKGGAAFDSIGNVTQAGFGGGGQATDPTTGQLVPRGGRSAPVETSNIRGHHLNRSAYTLKDGTHVEKGTKLVTNRRRNPGNPRALHRAVSRMASFQHMARRVEGQLAKVARRATRGRSASGMRGHKPGCGCVACKRR
jgi:hypothetical protein